MRKSFRSASAQGIIGADAKSDIERLSALRLVKRDF